MVLQEDEENMNGNNIHEVMGEVEETAEDPFRPENIIENEGVGRGKEEISSYY